MAEKFGAISAHVDRLVDALGVWVAFVVAMVMMMLFYALGLNF